MQAVSADVTEEGIGDRAKFAIFSCDDAVEECVEVVNQDLEIECRCVTSDQLLLVWDEKPRKVLLLCKPVELGPEVLDHVISAAEVLAEKLGIRVLVEKDVLGHTHRIKPALAEKMEEWSVQPGSPSQYGQCRYPKVASLACVHPSLPWLTLSRRLWHLHYFKLALF